MLILLYCVAFKKISIRYEGFTGSDPLIKSDLAYSDFAIDKNGNPTSTPTVQGDYLLNEYYPKQKTFGVLDIDSSDVWWQYPQFQVGSYEQETNNIRYSITPDLGGCMPVEFCNTMYGNMPHNPSNKIKTLPPVENISSNTSRNGYFVTSGNLNRYYNNN
jgi:hypothetical protein